MRALFGHNQIYPRTTERHQTPTRTMSRQERASHCRGTVPHFGSWRAPDLGVHDIVDPLKPGLLPLCKDQFHEQQRKTVSDANRAVNRLKQTEEVGCAKSPTVGASLSRTEKRNSHVESKRNQNDTEAAKTEAPLTFRFLLR